MSNVARAMRTMKREWFVPEEAKAYAEYDSALYIGYGQTISQPYTVEKMLEWLDVQAGQKVLDVGSGSGWTTAILSQLVGKKGHVTATEIIPQLVEFGRRNCEKAKVQNVEFHKAGKVFGWPDNAPYDRILVSAEAREVPQELLDQLAPEGKMVIPVGYSIIVVKKDGEIELEEHPGFIFVPLI